jgi:hypothetical protein
MAAGDPDKTSRARRPQHSELARPTATDISELEQRAETLTQGA